MMPCSVGLNRKRLIPALVLLILCLLFSAPSSAWALDEKQLSVEVKFLLDSDRVLTDEQLLNDYRYALVVAIPQSVYDEVDYTFVEHTFQSESEFVFSKNLAIETSPYTLMVRTSDGMQYVSRYGTTIEYQFDMKYTG